MKRASNESAQPTATKPETTTPNKAAGLGASAIVIRLCHIACLLAFCAGCERKPAAAPTIKPELAAFLAVGRSNAIADHLTNGMSDEQILRALGYDPATLRSNRDEEIDGHSVNYINGTTDITITRTPAIGIGVDRSLPKDQQKYWVLEK